MSASLTRITHQVSRAFDLNDGKETTLKKIYVVGIGPGAYEQMTIRAANALESCEVIIGYTVYVDLVREHFAGKEFLTTPMKQEVERCRMAFETAVQEKQQQ
mgnify:FL=1